MKATQPGRRVPIEPRSLMTGLVMCLTGITGIFGWVVALEAANSRAADSAGLTCAVALAGSALAFGLLANAMVRQ